MSWWRVVLGVGTTLAVVFALNFITIRTLLLAHPSRRAVIWTAVAAGNLMWALLPFVLSARTTPFVRIARALFGPPWFSWLIFVLLYSSLAVISAIAWLLFARKTSPFGVFAHVPSITFLILLGFLCVIGYYQALVPLRVERVRIPLKDLPPAFDGYRIALISDLHVGLFTRASRLRKISTTVNGLEPDLLTVNGDLIDDDPYFVPKFLAGLETIRPSTRILAVLGNHEIYGDPREVIRRLNGTRVQLLVNQGMVVQKGDAAIWVAGLSDYAAARRGPAPELRPDLSRALEGAGAGATVILLSHQPRAFPEAISRKIPLTLCGHTHGGQCGIRRLRWSLAGLFLPYHMGLYEREGCQLYVNTGAGYWVVPVRLGMTPEITLIELVSEERGRPARRTAAGSAAVPVSALTAGEAARGPAAEPAALHDFA